jgi:hypothetical protein
VALQLPASASPAAVDHAPEQTQFGDTPSGGKNEQDCYESKNRVETQEQNPWVKDPENPHVGKLPLSSLRIENASGYPGFRFHHCSIHQKQSCFYNTKQIPRQYIK